MGVLPMARINDNEVLKRAYETATGNIRFNMTNDYMFRAILQKNEFVLRGLIGALLHLDPDEIKSIRITNPIVLGEQIDNKTFILDIEIELNDDTLLNLEMQVVNTGNWPDRSLSYLCRMYDHLYRGKDYDQTKRAIHIGILDFTLFPEHPEFYACYQMANVKNHHIFSVKFVLRVLDLTQTEQATQEDRDYEIDRWARIFIATTWEELHMIADANKYMNEACAEMYKLNADKIIRQQCEAREDYLRQEKWQAARYAKSQEDLKQALLVIQTTKQEATAAKQEANSAKLEATAAKQEANSAKLEANAAKRETSEVKIQLAERDQQIADKDRIIAELQAQLKEQRK
jgi:predicted transposase/invertase (TIGR01784 family)